MDVEVEDVLPPRRPVRLDQVEAVWSEALVQEVGDLLGHQHDRGSVLFGDGPDVGRVCTRNDKGVALRRLPAIQEGQSAVVLSHDVGGSVAGDDPAEDAIGHRRSLPAATSGAVALHGIGPELAMMRLAPSDEVTARCDDAAAVRRGGLCRCPARVELDESGVLGGRDDLVDRNDGHAVNHHQLCAGAGCEHPPVLRTPALRW